MKWLSKMRYMIFLWFCECCGHSVRHTSWLWSVILSCLFLIVSSRALVFAWLIKIKDNIKGRYQMFQASLRLSLCFCSFHMAPKPCGSYTRLQQNSLEEEENEAPFPTLLSWDFKEVISRASSWFTTPQRTLGVTLRPVFASLAICWYCGQGL